jgi:preprotein translocase subunit SecA
LNTPSDIYRRISPPPARKFHQGMDAYVHGWMGSWKRRSERTKIYLEQAHQVDALVGEYEPLSDHDLRLRLRSFHEIFQRGGENLKKNVIPALAAVREAAKRCTRLNPFVEQLAGALALNDGCLTEMATGEGKTLTAGLAAVLAGWLGRPCHVITVNDYLVERDAAGLQSLYQMCGLKAAPVTAKLNPQERQKAYAADVVYVTSKEILADFLRDRIRLKDLHNPERWMIRQVLNPQRAPEAALVLRGLHTAIVDEADSVLIDEAVTPLLISSQRPNDALKSAVELAATMASRLTLDVHYKVDPRYGEVEFTPEGLKKVEEVSGMLPPIWRGKQRREELLKQAIVARELFHLGKQYIIHEGKVSIVDEFTGRAMPNRSWREGLHQAIEAKEGIPMTDPTETLARMSFQRFFRLFPKLSGMTGTAWEAAEEFWRIYHLPVVKIPTHKPCARVQLPDRVFLTDEEKWEAVVQEIIRLKEVGCPVLVGTRSVKNSELLSHKLFQAGVAHRVLNATRHSEEAAIIARAGEKNEITIATNMAGRGTDIRLGPGMAGFGGLHVISTERHESERVDRQLFGRAGRQGDPGAAQTFVSFEDELLKRHLRPAFKNMVRKAFQSKSPGTDFLTHRAWKQAQKNAQRLAFKQRANVLKYDTWLDEALSFAGAQ